MQKMVAAAGDPYFNPDSPQQVAKVLYDKLGLPKLYKRGSSSVTTSKVELEKKYGNVEFVAWIIEYRNVMKFARTYIPDLNSVEMINDELFVFHEDWKMHGTNTGRYSAGLHTYPPSMRRVVRARPGFVLIKADYKSIELFVDMLLSGDSAGLEIMATGRDFHRETAAKAFGKRPEDVTPEERHLAKFVVHGCRYLRGADSVAQQFHTSFSRAQEIVDSVLKPFKRYLEWRNAEIAFAHAHGYQVNPFKRRRWYLEGIEPPECAAFQAQSTAHDILMPAGNALDDKHPELRFLMDHHDAYLFEVPVGSEVEWIPRIKDVMEVDYLKGLHVPVECKTGECWGDLEERK